MNPNTPPRPSIGVSCDIILIGGNRIKVYVPAEIAAQGVQAAVQKGAMFVNFPQLAGDILINIGAIAAIEPVLAGKAPEADDTVVESRAIEIAR